jgi:cation diffusion facilitator CzcD-associated flavoprotein CzcO
MVTDDWYPALAKPNVELVSDRIVEVTESGVRTADGRERATDVLVLATGFETHGFVAPMEIFGAGGRALANEWSPVPRAYLGVSVPGSRICSCSTGQTRTAAAARSSIRSSRESAT